MDKSGLAHVSASRSYQMLAQLLHHPLSMCPNNPNLLFLPIGGYSAAPQMYGSSPRLCALGSRADVISVLSAHSLWQWSLPWKDRRPEFSYLDWRWLSQLSYSQQKEEADGSLSPSSHGAGVSHVGHTCIHIVPNKDRSSTTNAGTLAWTEAILVSSSLHG
jgi:hypothetical protein